jgi:hypothetical protein
MTGAGPWTRCTALHEIGADLRGEDFRVIEAVGIGEKRAVGRQREVEDGINHRTEYRSSTDFIDA